MLPAGAGGAARSGSIRKRSASGTPGAGTGRIDACRTDCAKRFVAYSAAREAGHAATLQRAGVDDRAPAFPGLQQRAASEIGHDPGFAQIRAGQVIPRGFVPGVVISLILLLPVIVGAIQEKRIPAGDGSA